MSSYELQPSQQAIIEAMKELSGEFKIKSNFRNENSLVVRYKELVQDTVFDLDSCILCSEISNEPSILDIEHFERVIKDVAGMRPKRHINQDVTIANMEKDETKSHHDYPMALDFVKPSGRTQHMTILKHRSEIGIQRSDNDYMGIILKDIS